MYMDYASFESTMTAAMEVFAAWDENIKEFTNVAREGETRDFVLVDFPRC